MVTFYAEHSPPIPPLSPVSTPLPPSPDPPLIYILFYQEGERIQEIAPKAEEEGAESCTREVGGVCDIADQGGGAGASEGRTNEEEEGGDIWQRRQSMQASGGAPKAEGAGAAEPGGATEPCPSVAEMDREPGETIGALDLLELDGRIRECSDLTFVNVCVCVSQGLQ